MIMKMSIMRGLFLFAAGAGCATVAAQMFPLREITLPEFQERFDKSMHEIIELSTYVRSIDEARVNVGLIACTPTPLPKMPDGALDPRLLKRAIKTMLALNDARMIGDSEPLQESIEKCRPVGE
jgi:hypothetical protein